MSKVKFQKVMITKLVIDQAGSFVNDSGNTISYVSRKVSGLNMSDPESFYDVVMKYPEQLSPVISSLSLGDVLDFECDLVVNKEGTYASFLISDIFKSGHSLIPSNSGIIDEKGKGVK